MSRLPSDIFALGVLELEDANLVQGLREDERIVTDSVNSMQRDMDRVREAEFATAKSTLQLTGAMSALGSAMSVTGAIGSALGGDFGRMVGIVASLGGAAAAATASFAALGTAMLPLVVPVGVIAAGIAAIAAAVRILALEVTTASGSTEGFFGDFVNREQFDAAQANLRAIREEHAKVNAELRKRQLLAEGVDPISLLPSSVQEQARRTAAAEAEQKARQEAAVAEQAIQAQIANISAERRRVLGIETSIDQIKDERLRKAARELELAKLERDVRAEALARERQITDQRIAQARSTNDRVRSELQSLAVSLELAKRSDFTDDPRLRLIAQVQEALGGLGTAQPRRLAFGGGALAFGGVRGPGGTITNARQENREQAKVDALRKIIPGKLDELIRLMETQGVIG